MTEALRAAIAQIPEVEFAYLFGSASQGLPHRDLDVAIFFTPGCGWLEDPLRTVLRLGNDLERKLREPVDLHILNGAPVGFAYEVSRGIVLVEHNRARLDGWREQVWLEYLDRQPMDRAYLRDLLSPERA